MVSYYIKKIVGCDIAEKYYMSPRNMCFIIFYVTLLVHTWHGIWQFTC